MLAEMVAEGLDYFDKAGDAGDKKYVAAIREHIRRLSIAPQGHGGGVAGAVATVCLVGERYAHGNIVEVQLQLAAADAPTPKIGDRYFTTPPTPSASVVDDATHVFNCRRCPVSVESRWLEPECPECGDPTELDATARPAALSGVSAPVGVEGAAASLVERAKALAHRAHAGQVDKAGRPYIEHVARVAAAVREDGRCPNEDCSRGEVVHWETAHCGDPSCCSPATSPCPVCDEAEAVAWLHDVLEDGGAADCERVHDFPDRIKYAVALLTRCTDYDYASYYGGIRDNPLALRVKLADVADNADESRLALLDEKTADRLRRKYAAARAALTPAAAPRVGIPVVQDSALPPGVAEFRDAAGNVLGTIITSEDNATPAAEQPEARGVEDSEPYRKGWEAGHAAAHRIRNALAAAPSPEKQG